MCCFCGNCLYYLLLIYSFNYHGIKAILWSVTLFQTVYFKFVSLFVFILGSILGYVDVWQQYTTMNTPI